MQCGDIYWELKGQILILCSNVLLQLNALEEDDVQDDMEEGKGESIEGEAEVESKAVEEGAGGSVAVASNKDVSVRSGSKNNATGSNLEASPMGESKKLHDEYAPILFSMIEKIFSEHAPKATLKIGLIYLAKILHFYQDFTDTYLKILLAAPENIRSAVVEVNPIPGTEEEVYVSGANSEKYRTYGAPLEWNSLFVAGSLEKHVKDSTLENLEAAHIDIFKACLEQDFYEEDIEKWLTIFTSLKSYFFIALCDRDFSNSAIEILKKFFCNPALQLSVLQVTLLLLIYRNVKKSLLRPLSCYINQMLKMTAKKIFENSSSSFMMTQDLVKPMELHPN